TGRRFTADNPADPMNLGSHLSDLKVAFVVGGKTFESPVLANATTLANASPTLSPGDQVVVAPIPTSLAVGLADILVRRPVHALRMGPPSNTVFTPVVLDIESNKIRLTPDRSYVFASTAGDEVAVINNGLAGDVSKQPLVAHIPV